MEMPALSEVEYLGGTAVGLEEHFLHPFAKR